jgi:hypothetical protein
MGAPLLLYLVGMSPHVATGTGALAVSANAFGNHARAGDVRWSVAPKPGNAIRTESGPWHSFGVGSLGQVAIRKVQFAPHVS